MLRPIDTPIDSIAEREKPDVSQSYGVGHPSYGSDAFPPHDIIRTPPPLGCGGGCGYAIAHPYLPAIPLHPLAGSIECRTPSG